MALYGIKSVFISEDKERNINNYDTELLPFIYKTYTGAVECIKRFVAAQVKENNYTQIDDHSCIKEGKYFSHTQNYLVTELIEME